MVVKYCVVINVINNTDGETKVLEENPVLVSICSPHIPLDLDRDRS